ncbi:YqgU-like beta propeller domain-containing protein [Bacillus timonensis]|uniref:YqgU-like beta propeller domain-containing protein n=1 Tax=Bacillus timonensis TaxID=1033734 RepID=UPI0011DCB26B
MRKSIFFFMFLVLLVGCNSHQPFEITDAPRSSNKNVAKGPVPTKFFGENQHVQPLDIRGQDFNIVGEWYDDESILYVVDEGGVSKIYRYHLFTGEKELFMNTSAPVLTMKANEDHSMFLIHTSDSQNLAKLTAVDKEGNIQFEWEVNSFDLFYSWNPYNTNQVFVTSFLEDWSFQTHLLDISAEKTTKFEVFQPFIQWLDTNTISYLKWDQNELDYFAPLYSYHLDTKTEGLLFENIISFAAYKNLLVTYELIQGEDALAKVGFYHPERNKKLYEYKMPLLSDYSKWYIPSADYVSQQRKFYSFKPYSTGAFDTYGEKFELVSYDLSTGKEEIILEKVDDQPLNFSPNGFLCLYGFQFEKVIDMRTKSITELVIF